MILMTISCQAPPFFPVSPMTLILCRLFDLLLSLIWVQKIWTEGQNKFNVPLYFMFDNWKANVWHEQWCLLPALSSHNIRRAFLCLWLSAGSNSKLWTLRILFSCVIIVIATTNTTFTSRNRKWLLCLTLFTSWNASAIWQVFFAVFFSVWVFLHEHSGFTEQQGKRKAIPAALLYLLHLLHKHLDNSQTITAESSLLHKPPSWTRTENLCFSSRSR